MQFHFFTSIARYEMKTLLRSWFFRIFAMLSLMVVLTYSLVVLLQKDYSFWIFKTLPGSLSYSTLLIVNLGQAVVAIFLSSEFLKQDQKNDSAEVIYVRAISNTTYILGKFAGVLLVFGVFNVVVVGLGAGLAAIGENAAVSPFTLVAYPLLISLPTLVFIIGLSFSLMVLIRNQAVVFILLLGYIALTVFYLNNKFYHALDYIGYYVPMLYSPIAGFGNISELALHRAIYLVLGLGFVFFTIYRFNRLPNRDNRALPLLTAIALLAAGGFMMYSYLQMKTSHERLKAEILDINDQYADYPPPSIDKCDIDLIHKGSEIEAAAKLEVENQWDSELDTLIFRLNPALIVDSVSIAGTPAAFTRRLHLVKIVCNPPLKACEKTRVQIAYHGRINVETAFAELEEGYTEYHNYGPVKYRKRPAFLRPDYVCLTSAVDWYPAAGPGYSRKRPYYRPVDFTWFTLSVRTSPGLTAISQGAPVNCEEGKFFFAPEYPLPQISLTIGNFIKRSATVDSLEFHLYTVKGNDYYKEYFAEYADSLPGMIRRRWNEKRDQMGLSYPFRRFTLVEVPVTFNKDRHKWSVAGNAIQPEMIFYPEKGVLWEDMDIQASVHQLERDAKSGQNGALPESIGNEVFRRMTANFVDNWNWNARLYNLSSQYFAFSNHFSSRDYPVFNYAMQEYLKDKTRGINADANQIEAHRMPVRELSTKAPDKEINAGQIDDIIGKKCVFLLRSLQARVGEKEFNDFLFDFLEKSRRRTAPVSELDSAFQESFGGSIMPDIERWYLREGLPAYVVKDIEKSKEKDGGNYEVSFKISNTRPSCGYIEAILEAEGPNRTSWYKGAYYMEGSTAKSFRLLVNGDPSRLTIMAPMAENVPGELGFSLSGIEAKTAEALKDTVAGCMFFANALSGGEIVVDNEDAGFTVSSRGNKGFLKRWVDKNRKESVRYDWGLRWWNPPEEWTRTLDPGFYGEMVHSAVYAKSGDGETQVCWKAPVREPGYYAVYFHYTQQGGRPGRRRKRTDYNLTVYHDSGGDEIKMYSDEMERGWNLLGTYYISSDSAAVVLSNRSNGDLIIGDAIKWVKTE